jgi:hypothetical protein
MLAGRALLKRMHPFVPSSRRPRSATWSGNVD